MKLIKFTNGNTTVVDDDMAAVLIAGGMATVEPPPAPKAAEHEGVFFSIGRGNDDLPMLFWRTSGPGQNTRGGAYTYQAACETVVYFNGKPHRPSPELLKQWPAADLKRGYVPSKKSFDASQSSGNVLLDTVTAALGKRPNDHVAFEICKGGDDGSKAACDAIYPPKY